MFVSICGLKEKKIKTEPIIGFGERLAAGKISRCTLAFGADQRLFIAIQVIILRYENLGLEAS